MRKISLILCSAGILTAAVAAAQSPAAPTAPPVVPGPPQVVTPPQPGSATMAPEPTGPASVAPAAQGPATTEAPAPIEPPVGGPAGPGIAPSPTSAADQTAPAGAAPAPAVPVAPLGAQPLGSTVPGHALNEFQGDDVAQVLRLLARQARISLVVSDRIADAQPPLKVTMRLEDKTPLEVINIIAQDKGLFMTEKDGVYYVKTKEEKEAEPTVPADYTFSYASAEKVMPLLSAQLDSKVAPQFDSRTNTIFYREVGSNLDVIKAFLKTIDQPTQQVMIEARLVEVTANPSQSYGFNWGGVFGNASTPQTFSYGGSNNSGSTVTGASAGQNPSSPTLGNGSTTLNSSNTLNSGANLFGNAGNFLLGANPGDFLKALGGQFAILSVPQMSVTMRFLNEDGDAEFIANPRIVTANNQQATIDITRNQPVPSLNFNTQTATAVFGGFEDKNFGNTLVVTPCINKDDFVTLNVKPKISDKVADAVFTFQGATVSSPIIDTRSLESTVLIKSGDTLAIGGLLQDQITKTHNKVPVLGDIPGIGYAFQEHLNVRTKRNLLVFVTPTIIKQGYGTGLEDQVNGLHHSGEEYADPNGWRNNASGALRLVPTSHRELAADYPKPGVAPAPRHPGSTDADFLSNAADSGNGK